MDPEQNNHSHEHSNEAHHHDHGHNNQNNHDNKTAMGILSYLGPLVIISYLTSKDDPFVKFHIKQGLVLLVIDVIIWALGPMFFWSLWGIVQLIHLALFVLIVIGIINVIHKKQKELPVVGGFSKYFKF